jgi:Fur family transcriptional regulator, ferric uptake regulator
MHATNDDAARRLKASGLRVTPKRRAVLAAILAAQKPLSYTQVLALVSDADLDQATVYRNLVKLRDAGVIAVASRANGIDRYALADPDGDKHSHPHFVCEDCGEVSCLPTEFAPIQPANGRWSSSIQNASIQLRGACPGCLDDDDEG